MNGRSKVRAPAPNAEALASGSASPMRGNDSGWRVFGSSTMGLPSFSRAAMFGTKGSAQWPLRSGLPLASRGMAVLAGAATAARSAACSWPPAASAERIITVDTMRMPYPWPSSTARPPPWPRPHCSARMWQTAPQSLGRRSLMPRLMSICIAVARVACAGAVAAPVLAQQPPAAARPRRRSR